MKKYKQENYTNSLSDNGNGKKIKEHLHLLEEVVREFQNSGEPEDQLKQVGYIGLLNAINLYKNKEDTDFEEYARQLIAGEIRHYIRQKHHKVKIPAWLNMMNQFINRILVAYRRQFNKFPELEELSHFINLSSEGLKEALKAREAVHKVSIDEHRRAKDIKEPPDTAKIKKAIKRRENGL